MVISIKLQLNNDDIYDNYNRRMLYNRLKEVMDNHIPNSLQNLLIHNIPGSKTYCRINTVNRKQKNHFKSISLVVNYFNINSNNNTHLSNHTSKKHINIINYQLSQNISELIEDTLTKIILDLIRIEYNDKIQFHLEGDTSTTITVAEEVSPTIEMINTERILQVYYFDFINTNIKYNIKTIFITLSIQKIVIKIIINYIYEECQMDLCKLKYRREKISESGIKGHYKTPPDTIYPVHFDICEFIINRPRNHSALWTTYIKDVYKAIELEKYFIYTITYRSFYKYISNPEKTPKCKELLIEITLTVLLKCCGEIVFSYANLMFDKNIKVSVNETSEIVSKNTFESKHFFDNHYFAKNIINTFLYLSSFDNIGLRCLSPALSNKDSFSYLHCLQAKTSAKKPISNLLRQKQPSLKYAGLVSTYGDVEKREMSCVNLSIALSEMIDPITVKETIFPKSCLFIREKEEWKIVYKSRKNVCLSIVENEIFLTKRKTLNEEIVDKRFSTSNDIQTESFSTESNFSNKTRKITKSYYYIFHSFDRLDFQNVAVKSTESFYYIVYNKFLDCRNLNNSEEYKDKKQIQRKKTDMYENVTMNWKKTILLALSSNKMPYFVLEDDIYSFYFCIIFMNDYVVIKLCSETIYLCQFTFDSLYLGIEKLYFQSSKNSPNKSLKGILFVKLKSYETFLLNILGVLSLKKHFVDIL